MNQEKIINLNIKKDSDYKLSFDISSSEDESVTSYYPKECSIDEIEFECQKLIDDLNSVSQIPGSGVESFNKLRKFGQGLCEKIIPKAIVNNLRNTDARYLYLITDDNLVQILWEYIYFDEQFLFERFIMGRYVKIQGKDTTDENKSKDLLRDVYKPYNICVLFDPESNLNDATEESIELLDYFDEVPYLTPNYIAQPTIDDLTLKIKDFDIIHFAGHAEYDVQDSRRSGWELIDGIFSTRDIDDLPYDDKPMPAFIFSNACQSSRTESWNNNNDKEDNSNGIVNAFMKSGVRHYLGPLWEVPDKQCRYFSSSFYKYLFNDNTMNIGLALNKARHDLKNKYGDDICWASFVLYGYPMFNYSAKDYNLEKKEKSGPIVIRSPKFSSKNVKNTGFWLFITIIFLVFLYLGYKNLDRYQKTAETKNRILIEQEARKENEIIKKDRVEKLKIIGEIKEKLKTINKSRQNNIITKIDDHMKKFNNINKKINNNNKNSSNETSEVNNESNKIKISIWYDKIKSIYKNGKEGIISSIIEKELRRCNNIELFELIRLNDILEHIINGNSDAVDIDERIIPTLKMADYILFIEVDESDSPSVVIMHYTNVKTSIKSFSDVIVLEDKHITKQKELLTNDILKFFKCK